MPAKRGIRKEDSIANHLAHTLVLEGQRVLEEYRTNIKQLPELVDQYARARIAAPAWEAYVTRLALASLSGENTLPIIADFNRRYIFPHRAEREQRERHG